MAAKANLTPVLLGSLESEEEIATNGGEGPHVDVGETLDAPEDALNEKGDGPIRSMPNPLGDGSPMPLISTEEGD